jgi:hypothetical protein
MTPEQQAIQDKREALREIEERASASHGARLRLDGSIGALRFSSAPWPVS